MTRRWHWNGSAALGQGSSSARARPGQGATGRRGGPRRAHLHQAPPPTTQSPPIPGRSHPCLHLTPRPESPARSNAGRGDGRAASTCGTAGGRTATPTAPISDPATRNASTAASNATSPSAAASSAEAAALYGTAHVVPRWELGPSSRRWPHSRPLGSAPDRAVLHANERAIARRAYVSGSADAAAGGAATAKPMNELEPPTAAVM